MIDHFLQGVTNYPGLTVTLSFGKFYTDKLWSFCATNGTGNEWVEDAGVLPGKPVRYPGSEKVRLICPCNRI